MVLGVAGPFIPLKAGTPDDGGLIHRWRVRDEPQQPRASRTRSGVQVRLVWRLWLGRRVLVRPPFRVSRRASAGSHACSASCPATSRPTTSFP